MSLDDLTNTENTARIESGSLSSSLKRKRSYAWLLPVGLLLGFLVILGLLFGERLLPAVGVKTARVVTIRAGEEQGAEVVEDGGSEVVVRGELEFQASGWVEPDPYTIYISTLVDGVVDEVRVLEGQEVKKGDLLATLISEDAELDLESARQGYLSFEKLILAHCSEHEVIAAEVVAAESSIRALTAEVAEARDHYERLRSVGKGGIPERDIIKARFMVDKRVAELAVAKAEIGRLEARGAQVEAEKGNMDGKLKELEIARDRAELALSRTRIVSSVDGTVLRLHAAPGKKRMLGMDDPTSGVIVELYDPQKLQARIDIPLNEAAGLSVGQEVDMVSDLLPNRVFLGRVTRISGQADLQRNTLQAKVEIVDPDPRLRPDMLVRAKFYSSGEKGVAGVGEKGDESGRLSIYVPEGALVSEGEVWVVSVDMRAERRKIRLGDYSKDGYRLVLDGLRSGEVVILPPHGRLSEGVRVKVLD